MLSYKRMKDMIHHGLEGGRRVRKAEKHDRRFVQAIVCFECCLMFVTLLDAYVVVPPLDIEFGIYVGPTQVGDEV